MAEVCAELGAGESGMIGLEVLLRGSGFPSSVSLFEGFVVEFAFAGAGAVF